MEKQEIISSGLIEMYVIGATSSEENAQIEILRSQHSDINEEISNIEKAFELILMDYYLLSFRCEALRNESFDKSRKQGID